MYVAHSNICHIMPDDDDMYRQCFMLNAQAIVPFRNFVSCSVNVKLTLFKEYHAQLYTAHLLVAFRD